jgi:hypothetical protein
MYLSVAKRSKTSSDLGVKKMWGVQIFSVRASDHLRTTCLVDSRVFTLLPICSFTIDCILCRSMCVPTDMDRVPVKPTSIDAGVLIGIYVAGLLFGLSVASHRA